MSAYNRCVKRMQLASGLVSCSSSAGFIIPNGQKKGKRNGYQVFVKVCKFSEELLAKDPNSGGLVEVYNDR